MENFMHPTRKEFYFALAVILITIPSVSNASFSDIGVGARPIGMGGAFAAIADDSNATFWNPAGLAQIGRVEFSSMYLKLYGLDAGSQLLTAAFHHPKDGGVGVSLLRTGESGLYTEDTLVFSAGQDLTKLIKYPIAAGLSLKRLTIKYGEEEDELFKNGSNVNKMAFDLGIILQATRNFRLGFVIENLNSPNMSLSDSDTSNNVARNLRVGCAYAKFASSEEEPSLPEEEMEEISLQWTQVIFAFEFSSRSLSSEADAQSLKIGFESWWRNVPFSGTGFAIRAGGRIANQNAHSFSVGGGYRFMIGSLSGVQIDYAFSSSTHSDLGDTHRVSVSLAF